jgi:hypothetical protein
MEVFDSHESLRSIFLVSTEIAAYADSLPEGINRRDRVNKVTAFLIDKFTDNGSAFLLFLEALLLQIPREDSRSKELRGLIDQIRSTRFGGPPDDSMGELGSGQQFDPPLIRATSHRLGDRENSPEQREGHSGPLLFLSYARDDGAQVNTAYQTLKDAGFRPWMDTRNIFGGEPFGRATARAVKAADFFLFFLSKHSANRRGYIRRELKLALDQWNERMLDDIYLIPVRLESCALPEELAEFQWVDLYEEDGWARLVRAIQEGLRRQLRK